MKVLKIRVFVSSYSLKHTMGEHPSVYLELKIDDKFYNKTAVGDGLFGNASRICKCLE